MELSNHPCLVNAYPGQCIEETPEGDVNRSVISSSLFTPVGQSSIVHRRAPNRHQEPALGAIRFPWTKNFEFALRVSLICKAGCISISS
jgi:hypothetical protein